MKKEKILNLLRGMDDVELVYIWNEYCHEANRFDDEILDAYTMEEWAQNDEVVNVLNRFYFGSDDEQPGTSANPNRNYFTFNGYGNIISFDYIYNSYTEEFNYIWVDDMIDFIIEEDNALFNDEIRDILDEEIEG